jgi:hypothetical protein
MHPAADYKYIIMNTTILTLMITYLKMGGKRICRGGGGSLTVLADKAPT